uniref:Large ribosomal subunit protein uL2 n=1 Tax=Latimeria chalumnae TaxID=7897 RepID=H3AA59_LATCH
MEYVIRRQREGVGSVFMAHKQVTKVRVVDFAGRHGYCKGINNVCCSLSWPQWCSGQSCILKPSTCSKNRTELFAAAEGHTGQLIYCGKKAQLNIGNVLPVSTMPEGIIVYCLKKKPGDCGRLSLVSGNYVTIISHNPDAPPPKKKSHLKLPSGTRKVVSSADRAIAGAVSGGDHIDNKAILEAGCAYHKNKVKRNYWPHVHGLTMNAAEHSFGGGKHQVMCTGKPSTARGDAAAGCKVKVNAVHHTDKMRPDKSLRKKNR